MFLLFVHSPLLAVFHGSVDGVSCAAHGVALGPPLQQGFDGLHPAQTAGHMERRFSVAVELVHP